MTDLEVIVKQCCVCKRFSIDGVEYFHSNAVIKNKVSHSVCSNYCSVKGFGVSLYE